MNRQAAEEWGRDHLPGEMRKIQEEILGVGRLLLTFVGLPIHFANALPAHLSGAATPALWIETVLFVSATAVAWIIRKRSFRIQAVLLTLPILVVSIASLAQWGPSFGTGILQMAVLSVLLVFFYSSLKTLFLVAFGVLAADALVATAVVQEWIPAPDLGYLDATVGQNWLRILLTASAAIPIAVFILFRLFRGAVEAWTEAERRFERLSQEQAAREEAQRALEQAQRMETVGRLASGLSHDFNNSLTVIMGTASLLGKRVRTPEERSLVAEIERATETAADLSTRLLIFSRDGRKEARPVDAGELLLRLQMSLNRLLPPDVRITVRSEATHPARVDPAHLEQAILNLCLNARDAMPKGGDLVLSARDGQMKGEPAVVLEVTDTGTGMDEETKARAFDPFFTTKPEGKGTGLGLAMVREMVDRHSGTLTLESAPGRGTTFHLSLPAWSGEELEIHPVEEVVPFSGSILLLDDDTEVRRTLLRTLEDAGHRVVALGRGEEAAAILEGGQRFDLLISDSAPDPDQGPSVVDRFLKACPSGQILLLTGHGDEALEERRLLRPGVELARKPLSPAALESRVHQLLLDGTREAG